MTVNPPGYAFEFGIEAEACIAYSYRHFYECGLALNVNSQIEDEHVMRELKEHELNRKRRKYDGGGMPFISYCCY